MTGEDTTGDDERAGDGTGEAEDSPDSPSDDGGGPTPPDGSGGSGGGADPERVAALAEELQATRAELAELESQVENRTVHRDDIAAELKRYVRARQRRGHATGWGPYVVLLYGTIMTLGAFFYLGSITAIAAMILVWLSTLGLYVVMVGVGILLGVGRKATGLRDIVGRFR